MAEGNQKILFVNRICKPQRLSDLVPIWAVLIFHENLTVKNIIGLLIVLVGVMVVQRYE